MLRRCSSFTLLTMLVRVLPTMPSLLRAGANANSTVSLTSTRRRLHLTELPVSIVASSFSCWHHCLPWSLLRCLRLTECMDMFIFVALNLSVFPEPVLLVGTLEGSFLASFLLGWSVTVSAGLASYPLDTIRYVLCLLIAVHCAETVVVVV